MKNTSFISVASLILLSLVLALVFAFPLFLVPVTEDHYSIQKLALLVIFTSVALVIMGFHLLLSKRLVFYIKKIDLAVILFFFSVLLSTFLSSHNKLQALLNPSLGLFSILTLMVFYFILSRLVKSFGPNKFISILNTVAVIISILAIIFFFNPFGKIEVIWSLSFLKNPLLNTVGFYLDYLFIFGFLCVLIVEKTVQMSRLALTSGIDRAQFSRLKYVSQILMTILIFVAFFMSSYLLFTSKSLSIMPSFKYSWFACIEMMKSIWMLFFGVGVDNYSIAFTQIKDIAFNSSELANFASFAYARSALLHIFTEVGLLGISSFIFLLWLLLKTSKGHEILIFYILVMLFFIPISLPVLFFVFLAAALFTSEADKDQLNMTLISVDVSLAPLTYITLTVILIFIAGLLTSFYGRYYWAEVNYYQAIAHPDKKDYERHSHFVSAISLAPFIEKYHIGFSNFNLAIAEAFKNSMINKNDAKNSKKQLSEEDNLSLSQLIKTSIDQSEYAIRLNSRKQSYWSNLADIYTMLIGTYDNAELHAIEAFSVASNIDVYNPNYKLATGRIYYAAGNYDMAIDHFRQAVSFKKDFPDAHYHLAWALFKRGFYADAVAFMENANSLYGSIGNKKLFENSSKNLKEFRKTLEDYNKELEKKTKDQQSSSGSEEGPKKGDPVDPGVKIDNTPTPIASDNESSSSSEIITTFP